MKHIKKIIGFAVFIGLIYLAIKFTDYNHIQYIETFRKEKFNGQIIRKYIDTKQHNYEMLVFIKKDGKDSLSFSTDTSGFYDFVKVNDSIIKIENSDEIRIVNRDTSFFISF